MPKKTCQLGLRQIIPLMIEFLWCLVIPTWSPVWNKITKDMKSINTQSATLRVIHTSARMFSDFYWTSPLACLDRPSLTVSPGQFTSPVVQLAASLEKWNQSRCQGGPLWCGNLWKKFIYWWLLSPRDLRISSHDEDCVKLKPHMASRPCHLALSLYNPFSGSGRSRHPFNRIYVVSSRHEMTRDNTEARWIRSMCKSFMYKTSTHFILPSCSVS